METYVPIFCSLIYSNACRSAAGRRKKHHASPYFRNQTFKHVHSTIIMFCGIYQYKTRSTEVQLRAQAKKIVSLGYIFLPQAHSGVLISYTDSNDDKFNYQCRRWCEIWPAVKFGAVPLSTHALLGCSKQNIQSFSGKKFVGDVLGKFSVLQKTVSSMQEEESRDINISEIQGMKEITNMETTLFEFFLKCKLIEFELFWSNMDLIWRQCEF